MYFKDTLTGSIHCRSVLTILIVLYVNVCTCNIMLSSLSLPQFDGVHIVSGSLDTSIRVWNADTGQCIHTLTG